MNMKYVLYIIVGLFVLCSVAGIVWLCWMIYDAIRHLTKRNDMPK